MKKNLLFLAKGAVFTLLLLAFLHQLNQMMIPKYISSDFPTTSTFLGFYEMEENSIDVLFLGSSHAMSAFSPQEFYDRFGLRTYNLGSQEQNMLLSYYWLREALRFQRPQAVVLDTFFCFEYLPHAPLNSNEATLRRSIDHMRWSSVKMEAIADICAIDESQTPESYYFPNIRYHGRWLSDLKETDFTPSEWARFYQMKGYAMTTEQSGNRDYEPFWSAWIWRSEPMEPLMREYLDRIVALCEEEGIALILVKTPTTEADCNRYRTMEVYAREHGLAYYDFNERALYEETGYDFAADNREWSHVNHWGAVKIAEKLGQVLRKEYRIAPVEDRQWEDSREYCAGLVENARLARTSSVRKLMGYLQNDRYTIFLAAGDNDQELLSRHLLRGLSDLGLHRSLLGAEENAYLAVISPEGVQELMGPEELSVTGSFRDGRSVYTVTSAGPEWGGSCSIQLDGVEYGKNRPGLNIVVYDHVSMRVADSVFFSIRNNLLTVTR